uniref:Uncharacterized protein n=1 Tax=Ditylenchus dipsaci TaxID=166011 RepID=A0A915CZA6_9BILA
MTLAMENNYANIIEAVCLRLSEERWKPINLESESNMNRFLEEMSDLGLSIDGSISKTQRYNLNIAQSACQFSRVALSLSRDFALIHSSHLEKLTENFEKMLWCEYLFNLSTGPGNEVHQATCQFIVSQVIPLCDHTYHNDEHGSKGFISQLLPEKFPALMKAFLFLKNNDIISLSAV